MIQLTKSGNAIKFIFDENDHYLYNGTIEVPVNSLTLVTDESGMFTFKKSATNDIFISGLYSEIGMTKSELESWYKENMVGSTGGGGDITSGEVQTMIDESISGKADSVSAVSSAEYVSSSATIDFKNVDGTVISSIDASDFVVDGMIDDVRIETISGVSYLVIDFNTASGKEDIQIPLTDIFDPSNYYDKDAIDGIVSGLNTSINTKLDASAYTPTDLSEYWTSGQTQSAITEATSGKADTSAAIGKLEVNSVVGNTIEIFAPKINGDLFWNDKLYLEFTSAFTVNKESEIWASIGLNTTSAVTSASTDSQIPTAKAVYDAIPTVPTSNTAFTNDAGYITSDALSGYAESSAVTVEINAATSGKADSSSVYTKSEVDDSISAATDDMATETWVSEQGYITGVDLSDYATTAYVDGAVSGKVDTSSVVTAVTSGSTDSEIPTAKAVFDAIPTGGSASYSAGRGIDITNDTISFSLPISSSTETLLLTDSSNNISATNSVVVIGASNNVSSNVPSRPTVKSIILGFSNSINSTLYSEDKREKNYIIGNNNSVRGDKNVVIGTNNIGYNTTTKIARSSYIVGNSNSLNCGSDIDKENNYIFGSNNKVYNSNEVSIGYYNNSVSDGTTSGNTFFSIGNGTADNARHNAFEIRQNGDIYLTKDGVDIKLQDNLGSTIEVSSAITSGDTNAVAGGAVYDKFDEVEQVTAAALNQLSEGQEVAARALNDLNDKFGGLKLQKITQAAYDALSGSTDSNTLYVIVN